MEQFEDIVGKTVASVHRMKHKFYDDSGFLRINFTDGTHCTIEAGYEDVFTGLCEGEYPTTIELADERREKELVKV